MVFVDICAKVDHHVASSMLLFISL